MSSPIKGMETLCLSAEINFIFLFQEVIYGFKRIQLIVCSNTFHLRIHDFLKKFKKSVKTLHVIVT